MPILSCRGPDGPGIALRAGRRRAAGPALGLLILTSSWGAWAHESDPDRLAPGLRLSAAAAVSLVDADDPIPMARLPGVLGTGVVPDDREGLGIEHATIAADWLSGPFGAQFALGWHGDGDSHVESAWVSARAHTALAIGAGRRRVPVGPVIAEAGHFDRFGLVPLAKRAAFDEDWIADGLNLTWNSLGAGAWRADAGLWWSDEFPVGASRRMMPVLHVGGPIAGVEFDAFVASADAPDRGTEISRGAGGHSHGSPSCDPGGLQAVCFDGRVDLAGLSARWESASLPLVLSGAWLARRERGELFSASGDSRYRGEIDGGWVEAGWVPGPDWRVALRAERVSADNRVSGIGASALAREAGLLDNEPSERLALAVGWTLGRSVDAYAELGRTRSGDWDDSYAMLRLIVRAGVQVF